MIASLIFHDSMLQPRSIDLSSVDWFYPIEKAVLNNSDTTNVRNRVYRSKRVNIKKWFEHYLAVDMTVYLHGASDPVTNCVRIYAWKKDLLSYNPSLDMNTLRYRRVGTEDFYEFTPITFNADTNVAIFNLKVDDTWDDFQILVSQPCTAVSVYLNPITSRYPDGYIKMSGSEPLPNLDEAPIADDFDGDNYDWEIP